MGKYNFDTKIDRRNTNSLKYDFNAERNIPLDVLPLWVADMDFETAPEVKEAIIQRASHGIFGYTKPKQDFRDALVKWMSKRHDWDTKPGWYFHTPGVMFGISMAIRALTEEGDSVLIQKPVYYPFSNVVVENNRKLINNALVYKRNENNAGKYTIDLIDFEKNIVKNNVKLFILCNPHNPVGRVWTRQELEAMGDICVAHSVTVISDEVHEDFIYEGQKHIPFAKVKPEYENISITCTSPSKTFNLAGLQLANIIVPNREFRTSIKKEMNKTGYDEPNALGMVACQAAYTYGEEWLEELKQYLTNNLNFVREFLNTRIPKIRLVEPEGTYLIWLDFSEYGLTNDEVDQKIIHEAKLWLDKGTMFGEEGEHFQRMNIAAPKQTIEEGLLALEKVFA